LEVYAHHNALLKRTAPALYSKLEDLLREHIPYVALLRETRQEAVNNGGYSGLAMEKFVQKRLTPDPAIAQADKEYAEWQAQQGVVKSMPMMLLRKSKGYEYVNFNGHEVVVPPSPLHAEHTITRQRSER
jgi:hypothetical protein